MKEKELEKSASSQFVVWVGFALSVVFLLTGIWYMYLKPLFRGMASG